MTPGTTIALNVVAILPSLGHQFWVLLSRSSYLGHCSAGLGCYRQTNMPPKRGKKGKRRGDESSDDDAGAIKTVSKSTPDPAASVELDSEDDARSGKASVAASHAAQGGAAARKTKKKKGKGARANVDDSDDSDVDALDPLAHLRGGGRKAQLAPTGSDDESDRPKKPLTKKEKRKLEEEQRKRELEVRSC